MLSNLDLKKKSFLMPATVFICPVVLGWNITCVQDKSVTLMSLVNKGVFQHSLYLCKTTCLQIFPLSDFAFIMLVLVDRIFEDKILIFV